MVEVRNHGYDSYLLSDKVWLNLDSGPSLRVPTHLHLASGICLYFALELSIHFNFLKTGLHFSTILKWHPFKFFKNFYMDATLLRIRCERSQGAVQRPLSNQWNPTAALGGKPLNVILLYSRQNTIVYSESI
jgi:hypothetical protein